MNSQPVVKVLSLWQFDDLPEIDARIEAGLSLFVQRVFHRSGLEFLLWPESLLLVEHLAELGQIHPGSPNSLRPT